MAVKPKTSARTRRKEPVESVFVFVLPVDPERTAAANSLTQGLADWERDSSALPQPMGVSHTK